MFAKEGPGPNMREWLWRHKMVVVPVPTVLMALGPVPTLGVSSGSWSLELTASLLNLAWWRGLYCLHARLPQKRKSAYKSRASSKDMLAIGSAACQRHQIVFQELISGYDAPVAADRMGDGVRLRPSGPRQELNRLGPEGLQ